LNKEFACGLSARERCLKGKLLLRELRILPEGFALQEELSHVNVTRSFLQSKEGVQQWTPLNLPYELKKAPKPSI